jgi:predicted dehydrogenase
MGSLSRRAFLGGTLQAAAVSAITPLPVHAADGAKAGPNEIVRIAVCGLKGRGGTHLSMWMGMKDLQVVGLCDVDRNIAAHALSAVEKKYGKAPRFEQDWRKLMEDKSIDAVSIATCNHTHTLLSLWAVQAGKHVYVEKPLSHNVWEGRKLVEAARKYGKCVQHGTQGRSSKNWYTLAADLRSGKKGKLLVSRGLCYKPRPTIGKKRDGPVPKGVDYDLWLGPAPVRPFNPNRFHYNWHWHWDYGNGEIGNQGVHQIDIARWMTGHGLPMRVVSLGGRYGPADDGETPNTQISAYDYGDCQVLFEVRGLDTDPFMGQKIGNLVHCDKQKAAGADIRAVDGDSDSGDKKASPDGGDHFRNFIDAVKANNPKRLNADVLEGHLSSALCHLANISHRLGTDVPFSSPEVPFPGNDAASEAFDRMKSHLKDHDVDLSKATYRKGRVLTFDPKAETFPGDAEAKKLLTREYRAPFVVPENV